VVANEWVALGHGHRSPPRLRGVGCRQRVEASRAFSPEAQPADRVSPESMITAYRSGLRVAPGPPRGVQLRPEQSLTVTARSVPDSADALTVIVPGHRETKGTFARRRSGLGSMGPARSQLNRTGSPDPMRRLVRGDHDSSSEEPVLYSGDPSST
jgi:hypothetical protein